MKKFIVKIMVLSAIVLAIDTVIGALFHQLVAHAKVGEAAKAEYICHHLSEDLLVFGSSRANSHYAPKILEDSLHLAAYNCGKDGGGIILSYGLYKLIRKRHLPKVIIYDVNPPYDLLENDNAAYLPLLRWYYDEHPVDSIIQEVSRVERYKMLLKGYRYNTNFLHIIINKLNKHQYIKGYRAFHEEMNYEPLAANDKQPETYRYDPLKLEYLERLVKECQASGIRFIFAVSPLYKNTDNRALSPLYELCRRYNLPLLDHYTDKAFNMEKSYFSDSKHLNEKGSTAYTSVIASEIKSLGILPDVK